MSEFGPLRLEPSALVIEEVTFRGETGSVDLRPPVSVALKEAIRGEPMVESPPQDPASTTGSGILLGLHAVDPPLGSGDPAARDSLIGISPPVPTPRTIQNLPILIWYQNPFPVDRTTDGPAPAWTSIRPYPDGSLPSDPGDDEFVSVLPEASSLSIAVTIWHGPPAIRGGKAGPITDNTDTPIREFGAIRSDEDSDGSTNSGKPTTLLSNFTQNIYIPPLEFLPSDIFNQPVVTNYPQGQTVVYKTPGHELRYGTIGQASQGSGHAVVNEQSITTITNPQGRVVLSPNAKEVAYIEAGSPGADDEVVIRSLSGGSVSRYSQTQLQNWSSLPSNSISNGILQSLEWCPTSGSDKLLLNISGGSELSGNILLRFDRNAQTTTFYSGATPYRLSQLAVSPSCQKIVYWTAAVQDPVSSPKLEVVKNTSNAPTTQTISNARSPGWGNQGIGFARNDDIWLQGPTQLTSTTDEDYHPVFFEHPISLGLQTGESLAFVRNKGTTSNPNRRLYLIERIDKTGPYTSAELATDKNATTFDIG